MKKLRLLFLALALLLCSISASAYDFKVDGINYNNTSTSLKLTVSVASGEYSGSVTIPDSVTYNGNMYSVESIGHSAFNSCEGLTSVAIPNSVTSIGDYAFRGCRGLTSVVIPNSVTSIGEFAFDDCSYLIDVVIGENVRTIAERAFEGCIRLIYVINLSYYLDIKKDRENGQVGSHAKIILNGESEGGYYFKAENGVRYLIGYWGEETDLTLPVKPYNYEIKEYGLGSCRKNLSSVTMPNSVTSIGAYAFYQCTGLTSVTIGSSVTSIGDKAFIDSELRTVVCLNPEVPAVGSDVYSQATYNHATLYVPEGTYWAYAYDDNWYKFIHMKEIAISDEALASNKAYMIADAKGCNYTVYDAGRDELVNVEYTFALDEENEGACWTVMKEGGESYLYNIGAKKFAAMNEDGKLSLSDAPVNLDIATTESGLSINGNARMFVLNDNVDVDVTAINGITADGIEGADAPVYNLQGMKMQNADNLPKGVYIKGGKKYLVK